MSALFYHNSQSVTAVQSPDWWARCAHLLREVREVSSFVSKTKMEKLRTKQKQHVHENIGYGLAG